MRAFISRPRCIYTGVDLVVGDPNLRPSHEHIIPLALGGSNQFVSDEVSAYANSKAGNEIDDEVASSLPVLTLRHRYGFVGNRGVVPKIHLEGEFLDINARASLDIGTNGNMVFQFNDEQRTHGQVFEIASTEERVRFFLRNRLRQAEKQKLKLFSPFGQITDDEDIEIALMLADRNEGRRFKGSIKINVADFHYALMRLNIKVALGLGHRVLGPEWTFGPSGMMLRDNLFRKPSDRRDSRLRGSLNADFPDGIADVLGLTDDRHVMLIVPVGKTTSAIISLFGGAMGTTVIDLQYDSRRLFRKVLNGNVNLECMFSIPLLGDVKQRRLESRTFHDMVQHGIARDLVSPTPGGPGVRTRAERRKGPGR